MFYQLYYAPKSRRETEKKFGGKKNFKSILAEEERMKFYAFNTLAFEINCNPNGKYKINFLTGDKFIHQSLFCAFSFLRFLDIEESQNFSIVFYSDGTLSDSSLNILKSKFPQIRIIEYNETLDLLETLLPRHSFPYLNRKVETLPLFKKLVFTHLNKTGLSTFFDSDMLFWRRPTDFLNWLYSYGYDSNHAFCIQDVKRSYGYADEDIFKVWPLPIDNNINSGMYSIHSARMDFKFIEELVKNFEEMLGSQYYMEQLITSIVLEQSDNLYVASKDEYIVLPTFEQVRDQTGTLHHYVNEAKEVYFKEAWRYQIDLKSSNI